MQPDELTYTAAAAYPGWRQGKPRDRALMRKLNEEAIARWRPIIEAEVRAWVKRAAPRSYNCGRRREARVRRQAVRRHRAVGRRGPPRRPSDAEPPLAGARA
jgi:hypothetical protein